MSKKNKKNSKKDKPLIVVRDPFEMNSSDIIEAQNSDEELELDDFDLSELDGDEDLVEPLVADDEGTEATLKELSKKMAEEEKRNLKSLEAQIEKENEAAQLELEAQIKEDIELQEEEEKLNKLSDQDIINEDPEVKAALPKKGADGDLDLQELQSCIESILFVSEKPLSAGKLKEYLAPEYPTKKFKKALTGIQERYEAVSHGIELVEVNGGYQFRTKPGRAALAKKLAKIQSHRLSRGAMETLAIIAYKQPALKDDIDSIRGVDSSHFIRTLMDKRLISMTGRSELPGRPIIYETSSSFLEVFGLNSLESLPPLQELESMIPASESDDPDEDPKIRKIRELVNKMNEESGRIAYNSEEDDQFLSEIREKVKGIDISTPTLQAEDDEKKEAKTRARAIARGEISGDESDDLLGDSGDQTELLDAILTPSEGASISNSSDDDEEVISASELSEIAENLDHELGAPDSI